MWRMLLFTHPAMLGHDPTPGHPESPARLAAVLEALSAFELDRREAPQAARDAIERVHPRGYVEAVASALAEARRVQLDPDTSIAPGSEAAIYRAAGACVAAVDAVMAGEDEMAFCAVRPPGHQPSDFGDGLLHFQ